MQYQRKVPGAIEAYRLTVPLTGNAGDYVIIEGGMVKVIPGKQFEEQYEVPGPLSNPPLRT